MNHPRVPGSFGIAALAAVAIAAAAVVYAQTTVIPMVDTAAVETVPLDSTPEQVVWGDAKAGATKAAVCAGCHGVDGNPVDPPQFPRLAGQSERYIAQQMALFKSGERNTGMAAVMKPFADMLSAQDARDVGAYFATRKSGSGVADDAVIASGPNAGKKFFEVGQQLFRGGDPARGMTACMACHGPGGAGNPGPAYPHLAGQQAEYHQRRLEEYRAGITTQRDPHLFNVMAANASQLTDEEIRSLASYLQGLHDRDLHAVTGTAPAAAVPAASAPAVTPVPTDAAPATPDATVPAAASDA